MEEKYSKRDLLAKDRTHFANERTLLAYWRTSLAFLGLGVFLLKFFSSVHMIIISGISIIFGILLFGYGAIRFFITKKKINEK